MRFPAFANWQVQGPAVGGGVVRRFERPPEGMFKEPEFIAATGVIQWLEREGEELVVLATITVSATGDWSKSCALAAVFDAFLQKIE